MKPANEMTKQEMFDAVWDHFVVKGSPKSMQEYSCRYRGPGGSCCAVGVLMTDEQYSPGLEDRTADDDKVMSALGFDPADEEKWCGMQEFLLAMQSAHDQSRKDNFRSEFKAAMRRVAESHGLTVPA